MVYCKADTSRLTNFHTPIHRYGRFVVTSSSTLHLSVWGLPVFGLSHRVSQSEIDVHQNHKRVQNLANGNNIKRERKY